MKSQHIRNQISEMQRFMAVPQYEVTGFAFDIDDGTATDYDKEVMAARGFPIPEGAPVVAGMVYVEDSYQEYLDAPLHD